MCQTDIVSVSSYGHVCVRQSRHMDMRVSDWDNVCLVIWTCVRQTEIVSVSSYGRECVRQSRHMDVCVSD